jgi:hypothetical protein
MRLLFVILLIALMPLRSWAGDAMAIQMAGGALSGGPAAVAPLSSVHDDCPGHHGPSASQTLAVDAAMVVVADAHAHAETLADGAQNHCGNCAFCQACFTVALMGLPGEIAPWMAHSNPPRAGLKSFTSAEIALGNKPPIS